MGSSTSLGDHLYSTYSTATTSIEDASVRSLLERIDRLETIVRRLEKILDDPANIVKHRLREENDR
jgi:transcriptional regulatory protein LevR